MAPFLFRTSIAVFAAVFGALLGVTLGRREQKRLPLLLFAAAGVLLAVLACDVLPEAKAALSWPAFLLAGGSGWALIAACNRYICPVCPACAFSEKERSRETLRKTTTFLLIALGLHCVLDGVAVVVGDEIARRADTGLLFALTFHKIPEGFALAVLLLASGWSRRQSLGLTFLVEMATVAGGMCGAWLVRGASPVVLSVLLAHVGGGFLFLVLGTLRTLFDRTHPSAPLGASRLGSLSLSGGAFAGTAGLLLVMRFFGG